MSKEEAVADFLNGLRIAINNAFAYNKDHPYFLKSAEEFKLKIDALFAFLNPVKIEFTTESVFFDGKFWENAKLYVELAQAFHFRKIRGFIFYQGLTGAELVDFFGKVSLPAKEIIKNGGLNNLLAKAGQPHIVVDEIDYSQLLREGTEEAKDIWAYLFKEALEHRDFAKMEEMARDFPGIAARMKIRDLREDIQMRQQIFKLFAFLKERDEVNFLFCLEALFLAFLKDRDVSADEDLFGLPDLFFGLPAEFIAAVLRDGISKEPGFDYVAFGIFCRLVENTLHEKAAAILEREMAESRLLEINPAVRRRMRELFSAAALPAAYQRLLSGLGQDILGEEGCHLEPEATTRKHFLLALLGLAAAEKDKQALADITGQISREAGRVIREKDAAYAASFFRVRAGKIKEDASLAQAFEPAEAQLGRFLEGLFFEEKGLSAALDVASLLHKSYLSAEFYLERIFEGKKVTPHILQLFFRFFPQSSSLFYDNLNRRRTDAELFHAVIDSAKTLTPVYAGHLLKELYLLANNMLKLEVLQAMAQIPRKETAFLLSLLPGEDEPVLKKEAMRVISGDHAARKQALEALFPPQGLLGRNNNLLINNIAIIEELRLEEARPYLLNFSKRPFFWNRALREKAAAALSKYNAG